MGSQFEAAVEAVISGDIETLESLLRENPSLVRQRSSAKHKATLLHYVAANGVEEERQRTPRNAVEIAELLLSAGAEVDALAQTYGGGSRQTPLMLLVSSAHPAEAGVQADLVETFCKAGAAVNGLDDDGAPVATALLFWYPKAAEALARCGARVDNIIVAAALGRLDLVEGFLNPKARPRAEAIEQAFVYAAMCGRLEVAKALLKEGVDVNAGPSKNQTALHSAAYSGQSEMIEFLIANGADANVRDDQFEATPAGWAWENGHREITDYLLERSHPDITEAIEYDRLDLVKALLGDADPNQPAGGGGGEPGVLLTVAAYHGRSEIAEFLLERGADPNIGSVAGKTALQHAIEQKHDALADLLRERGAKSGNR